MEKLYIKFEEWNKSSLEEAIKIAKELWYKEFDYCFATSFKWKWILSMDNEWEYWTTENTEKELINYWYKEYKQEIKKLILETENLGKPTNPKIEINPEIASETIPQAWENDWNWYYNWEGAIQEAEYLWKKIPNKEQWEEIVKDYWDDSIRLSKELKLTFSGYREWSTGTYYHQSSFAYYWSSSNTRVNAYSLYFSASNVNPTYTANRSYGFSIRCIKNSEDDFINWEEVEVSDDNIYWFKRNFIWMLDWKRFIAWKDLTYWAWIYCRKIKEEEVIKPRFKVGQYTMYWITPLLIISCELVKTFSKWDIFIYNKINNWNSYTCYEEKELRLPTEEELKEYFK